MTPQEAQMLEDLVRKVEGTALTEKDPDAEALLNDGLARDPDAIYKLAQTVLIQNLALEQAGAQMQRMQRQLASTPQPSAPAPVPRATSFLGGLLHRNAPPAPAAPPQYQTVPPQYAAAPQPGTPAGGWGSSGYGPPPPAPGYGAPAGGGFLRSAATTAAGVAGGMLAFEGLEHLLHGGMGGGMGYGGGFGGFGGAPMEETVVNNYYEEPQGGQQERGQSGGDAQGYAQDAGAAGQETAQDRGDAQGYLDDSGGGYQDGGDGQDQGQDDGQDYAADVGDGGSGDDQGYMDDSGGDFGGDSGGDFGGD